MLQWTEEELRAMREADAEIDAQVDLFPGVNRDVEYAIGGKKNRREYQRAYYRKES